MVSEGVNDMYRGIQRWTEKHNVKMREEAKETRGGDIVRRKSHIGWNWSRLFCRLIRVYIGLGQYFSEGVQNFVHWHFFLNPIWPLPQPNIIKMTITP